MSPRYITSHQDCACGIGLEQHVVQRALGQGDEVGKVVGCQLFTIFSCDRCRHKVRHHLENSKQYMYMLRHLTVHYC